MAIAGMVISIIAIVLAILFLLLGFGMVFLSRPR